MGGWVEWVEEIKAVGMGYCVVLGERWVGGWVGGWDGPGCSSSSFSSPPPPFFSSLFWAEEPRRRRAATCLWWVGGWVGAWMGGREREAARMTLTLCYWTH